MRTLLLLFFVGTLSTAMAQENFDSVKIVPQKLSEHIYLLKGAGGNIGVLIGKDGTLMVDDQFAPLANRINGAIKTLDPGEIRFLVNTHVHGDHSGGNENFKRMGVTVVAQENVRLRMQKAVTDANGKETQAIRDKDALPVVTFPSTMSLHLNDEEIELIHLDPAHTDGDIAIWFKKSNIFHMGDMFVTYGYPYIDYPGGGSINGFISTLDKLMALMNEQTRIIPGHGDLSSKADIKKFRDTLADIRDQTAAALKKGKKVEEITALPIATKYDAEWGKGFTKGKDFVLGVAENLKASMPTTTKSK